MRTLRTIILLLLLTALAVSAAGCGEKDVSAKSDETVCVFDGSDKGSQKFKFQIFPGQEPRKADGNDEIVRIPASNRFYAAFENRRIADAGAPEHYLGYAKSNVPVLVQGSLKFRFNLDNACEWYAKHGRRNAGDGGLGFNARSDENASDFSPWVNWLNENFGAVNSQTIKSTSDPFSWPELVYGNDPQMPARKQPVDIAYGKYIGQEFTRRINQSLGGTYFCGTDVSLWTGEDGINETCPPIFFETGPIRTDDEELMAQREETEKRRNELENEALADQQEAADSARATRLAAERLKSDLRAERLEQALLKAKRATAILRVQAEDAYQRCIRYARLGLDCKGNRFPTIVVSGTGQVPPSNDAP